MPETIRTMVYGQTRTILDLLKVMDEEDPIMGHDDVYERVRYYIHGHVQFGGDVTEFACCLLRHWDWTKDGHGRIDLAALEEALMDKNGQRFFVKTRADEVYWRYCVAKLIHYIELLNEFRRYTDWKEIESDIRATLPYITCGGILDFFSVSYSMLNDTLWTINRHWDKVSDNGRLSSEKLEKLFFKDFQKMVSTFGLEPTVNRAYSYQGCHPDWLVPTGVVGPLLFRTEDGRFDVRCGSAAPIWADTFELRYAFELLRQNEDYVEIGSFYVPVRDFTLPVYHHVMGKVRFDSPDKQKSFILDLLQDRNKEN